MRKTTNTTKSQEVNGISLNISSDDACLKLEDISKVNISFPPNNPKIMLGDYSFTATRKPNETIQLSTTSNVGIDIAFKPCNFYFNNTTNNNFHSFVENRTTMKSLSETKTPVETSVRRFTLSHLMQKSEKLLEKLFGYKENDSLVYHTRGVAVKPSLFEALNKYHNSKRNDTSILNITKTTFSFLKNSYVKDSRTIGWYAISTTSSTLLTLSAMLPYIYLSKIDLNNSSSLSKISGFLEDNLIATTACYFLFLGIHYSGLYMMEMGREGLDNLQKKGGILKEFIKRPFESYNEVIQSTKKNLNEFKENSQKTLYASIIDLGLHLPSDILSNFYAFGSSLAFATPIYSGLLYLELPTAASTILAVSTGFLLSQLTADAGVAFFVPIFWNGAKTAANYYYEKKTKRK